MAKKSRKNVALEHSAQIRAAYQLSNIRGKKLLKMFPQYSKAAIYKHARKPLNGEPVFDKRKANKGRPSKLSPQDKRSIVRSITSLRQKEGSFTSKRVQVESGVSHVSGRTIRNCLNEDGYWYLQTRKKGLLHAKDLKSRVKFCKKIRKQKLGDEFWRTGISFYLDGKGFQYKSNPYDQARAPGAREWRKRGEGLKFNCTAKGKKEGGINVNFMVAISYGKGVVLCEQYEGTITGPKFAEIVKSFPKAFNKSSNPKARRFLMDGCPRQNSKVAMRAIDKVNALVLKIPPRSPDLNPIENFFHTLTVRLNNDAFQKNITKETFKELSSRVKETILSVSSEEIDKIIDSMDKRITAVLKGKGQRTKY
jgi:transposase